MRRCTQTGSRPRPQEDRAGRQTLRRIAHDEQATDGHAHECQGYRGDHKYIDPAGPDGPEAAGDSESQKGREVTRKMGSLVTAENSSGSGNRRRFSHTSEYKSAYTPSPSGNRGKTP